MIDLPPLWQQKIMQTLLNEPKKIAVASSGIGYGKTLSHIVLMRIKLSRGEGPILLITPNPVPYQRHFWMYAVGEHQWKVIRERQVEDGEN